MKILIATGIYPPDIGGPAQYAFNLEREFQKLGHEVRVIKFSDVKHWPSGLRHIFYFFKIFPTLHWADWCLTLDTFSVGLPSVMAGRLLGKKTIIRTGGDFLWENYVERTGKLVLLRNFYQTEIPNFNFKERLIFKLTRWILKQSSLIVFSTDWQRQIWAKPYNLDLSKTKIIENYYGRKEVSNEPEQKVFISAGRNLKLKNFDILKPLNFVFEIGQWSPEKLTEKIRSCYGLIVPSVSEISPNIVLDAIRCNKPFILTEENGIQDRLGEIGIYINPLNLADVEGKLLWLSDKNNYETQIKKITNFNFEHSWSELAREFLDLVIKI
jgi:glycosyltransferase involved in cell wall biosynthesis